MELQLPVKLAMIYQETAQSSVSKWFKSRKFCIFDEVWYGFWFGRKATLVDTEVELKNVSQEIIQVICPYVAHHS